MDPFTQRMLEKAEQRSRALGICSVDSNAAAAMAASVPVPTVTPLPTPQKQPAPKPPLHITNSTGSISGQSSKLQVVERTPPMDASGGSGDASSNKVLRQFSAIDKENMDLGIEINIMTDKNIEVQVQVEQEVTDDEEAAKKPETEIQRNDVVNQPLAKLRDTSRNRLQRLGALYSNTDDLSSPIHRTEGKFHAESGDDINLDASPCKPKQRYGKLAALANSINQWEDDTSHHALTKATMAPPPKPDLPSRKVMDTGKKGLAPQPPPLPAQPAEQHAVKTQTVGEVAQSTATAAAISSSNNKTKQLKWDPKVINSLEAQGFQRRESSSVKLAYDYKDDATNRERTPRTDEQAEKANTATTTTATAAVVETKKPTVKPGLVSGRAAVFESKANQPAQQPQRPQKDPTELSLRERMQLFEKNKGEALIPKAAFGMAPSINKIRQDAAKGPQAAAAPVAPLTAATALVKPNADSKVRNKVAALVAGTNTISENSIIAEIQKQRQEEMQLLANRFHKPKDIFANDQQQQQQQQREQQSHKEVETQKASTSHAKANVVSSPACPPPPPPPPAPVTAPLLSSSKRRSPGDAIDEESKRAKTATINAARTSAVSRLYPALSGLESNESLDNDDNYATTATASGRSTAEELLHSATDRRRSSGARSYYDEDQDNDSYMESEPEADDSSAGICNGSLGREIMHVVKQNDHQQQQQQQQTKHVKEVRYAEKNHYYGGDSSINSSEASMGIDDYLDEALDDDNVDDGDDDYTQESDDDNDRASRESKGTTTSNSFSFRKTPKKYVNYNSISEDRDDYHVAECSNPPVRSQLSVNHEDENTVTLVHTVSFYRRQQKTNSANSTPIRKVCREQQLQRSALESMQYESPVQQSTPCHMTDDYSEDDDGGDKDVDSEENDDTLLVQDKIKKLLDEVCKQQQVIGQTSQALNLCASTIEFSGSTESVEAERHLLVASHRRQACLDEVQRLRVEKTLRPLGAPKEKGRLTVREITVPLRQDYIRKLAADTISGHHLVCLLKYNEHVLATKTVPTLPGLVAVKFPDVLQLNNVYADFRISLEIYGMTAQREVLPHEIKYHINLNKKPGGIKTPKKKGGDNRLIMPPVQSPAGPNAVRTSTLVQYGFAIFSLREIQRKSWSLTQALGISPLDGVVHMKVNCELSVSVEYKGFLTMFEDTSGVGAWHRRWCYLNGTVLNYWKYPEDEHKKTPIGTIDLYECTSQKVGLAPRDVCARLNTMLLECQRPSKEGDMQSHINVINGRNTIIKHLLTADTKEEREEWCAYFNKALTLLRAWGPISQ